MASSPKDISAQFAVARSDIRVPVAEQKAYVQYHEKIDCKQSSETEALHSAKRLFGKNVSLDEKRELLFRLAHIGTIRSFDLLCKYLKKPDPALKGWAVLCLEECRMYLEMDLLDEDEGGMIMGPSGGLGQQLRYYVVIGTDGSRSWQAKGRTAAKRAFAKACERWNSRVEKVSYGTRHILLTILIHIDTAPDDLIMEALRKANGKQILLKEYYYITNVEKPDEAAIRKYLKEFAR
ncbi:MAG: hypothetical protein PHX87_02260 [Candidatus Peribacteraceae bacterium]|nr:hypothetical protein [Candidatus Peribacteraceae bacterium]MDD5742230.1 hypothetical protein [Candidatus Peribacteraceae bacterium]